MQPFDELEKISFSALLGRGQGCLRAACTS